jgi:type II secretory pathway component GspD/PulD (secretin)
VIQDPRTNSLIVTDIPSQFDVIEKIVALLDTPTPQVMIEVEMLDVDKNTIDEMGISTSQHLLKATGAITETKFPFFADATGSSTPATFQYGTLDSSVFTATLDFLTTDSKTKFLARPRILTLSNESAEIKITTEEATGVITTTAGAGGSVGAVTTTPERFETGISLKVTPQIDPQSGTVTMFIQPIVSQTKASPITNPDNGVPFRDPEVRTSATTLRIKDGETIVVGGLIKTNDETNITKIPFFGDLPLVGAAFRHKEKKNEERELIVFITPHIVGQDNVVALAKGEPIGMARMPLREQSSAVTRKEEVDNMLERWEN